MMTYEDYINLVCAVCNNLNEKKIKRGVLKNESRKIVLIHSQLLQQNKLYILLLINIFSEHG